MDPSPRNLQLILDGEVKIGRALKAAALFLWRAGVQLFQKAQRFAAQSVQKMHGLAGKVQKTHISPGPANSGHAGASFSPGNRFADNIGHGNRNAGAGIEMPTRPPDWNRFWNVVGNLPWLLLLWLATICVVFFWTRRDTEERVEAKYARAQVNAIERGARAQSGLDAQREGRETTHDETRARIRSNVQQTQEDITNADDLEAIQRAYLAGVERMRNDARAARAKAVADYVESLAD